MPDSPKKTEQIYLGRIKIPKTSTCLRALHCTLKQFKVWSSKLNELIVVLEQETSEVEEVGVEVVPSTELKHQFQT